MENRGPPKKIGFLSDGPPRPPLQQEEFLELFAKVAANSHEVSGGARGAVFLQGSMAEHSCRPGNVCMPVGRGFPDFLDWSGTHPNFCPESHRWHRASRTCTYSFPAYGKASCHCDMAPSTMSVDMHSFFLFLS